MRTFEELDCWKKATALRKKLSQRVKTFPSEERFRLIDQIIRSSRSATANIAEGYGRFHYQEFIQFCRQSRGSLLELIDHLIVAHDENYIDQKELEEFKQEIQECCAVLNGFINYLQKAKVDKGVVKEPNALYNNTSSEDTCETNEIFDGDTVNAYLIN